MNLFLSGLRSVAGLSSRQRRSKALRSQTARTGGEFLEPRIVLSAIVGNVYDDADASGDKTGGDNELGGWTVFLDLDNSGTLNNQLDGSPEPSATTKANGEYAINAVAPGLYRVSEIVQAGWTPTAPISQDVTVIAGEDSVADFFNFAGGNIVGTVINDADGTGLAGWTVFLDLSNDGIIDSGEPVTVTDEFGQYSFSDLPARDYEVTEILPDGWETDFDTKQTAEVVALGTVTLDFVNFSLTNGSIRGTVWNDMNVDGIRQTNPSTGAFTEPGLAGWTIFLDVANFGILDPGEIFTVTDAEGNYGFVSLPEGSYEVTEVLPPGWNAAPTFDTRQTVDVGIGENSTAGDFANFTIQNGSIRGTIWNDLNRDGVRNTSLSGAFTDPGLAGWTVYLDLNHNNVFELSEPTSLTDGGGNYIFADLQVGDYDVIEILPTGWETAPGFGDNQTVTVFSGAKSTASDFANFELASALVGSVSGFVWNDLNGNGLFEGTEPGLEGWTLFVDLNSDGVLNGAETQATTGTDGSYSIPGVTPGTISIVELAKSGWHSTAPLTGKRSLTLRNGENASGINFGNAQLRDSSIRGVVFADTDKDGSQGALEHGLAGIVVYLDLNNDGNWNEGMEPSTVSSADLYYTPTVDEAGSYSFTHLGTGTYTVRQVLPAVLSSTPSTQFEHIVSIIAAEDRAGVNFADVYRPNEIHGVKFNDADSDHVKDPGEVGINGTTIFIDLNRNNLLDADEPRTVTHNDGPGGVGGTDGVYVFTDLTPGAYVVREVATPGFGQTFPTTVGGTLWPDGVSNPAQGNVSPISIEKSLAAGEKYRTTVSLTLPNTGALTNAVDVFLLFDDTGSFVNNSPIVRAAFPAIISDLQMSLPGVDLGFGVGRFEEYGNFAYEYSTGRPFVLNQPIVAASTAGYMTAIDAALNRTTPGYGGDGPETDIEALYQLVTGLGFDGNNNGSVMDSGAAGLGSTQLVPGNSGDVPSFASFTADASANVLPAAGTVGGAGFRAGALPVILLATDIGFAYQPKGETTITGVNGLTLPVSALTGTSRPSTPFNSGAGLQETITGLNALGALVIGLGTNTQTNVDPRQGLEAISKLTGATNQSSVDIPNGTPNPIKPSEPLYFQISSGFAASVADGIQNAIQNAVTNVAVNMTVQSSDPSVKITNYTGTIKGLIAGQIGTFDIEFTGDGVPHRFDLQFVREGTSVVLGSIPVVLGTPIPGDGYQFDDLAEGEIELEDHFGDTASVANVAPSFVKGENQVLAEDSGTQTVTGWATDISPGAPGESGQVVNFVVTSDNPGLFSTSPQISPDGTLTFTSALNASGIAVVTVTLHDDGGTLDGGIDASSPQEFTITVMPVNDAPTDISLSNSSVAENAGAGALVGTLSGTDPDAGDTLSFSLPSGFGDNSAFTISGTTLSANASFDFENRSSYSITVRVSDAAGMTFDKVFTISVTNVTELSGIDVQNGQTQRSYLRDLDVVFDQSGGLMDLINNGRLELTRFDLNGLNGSPMSLPPGAVVGNNIRFDFGAQGIGGNRNTNAGDGYYELGIDMDGDGSFESKKYFHRLLGDMNGDGVVSSSDKIQVLLASGSSSAESDVNGDGLVNILDTSLVSRAVGRKLKGGLFRDD